MKKSIRDGLVIFGFLYGVALFMTVLFGLSDASGPELFDNCDEGFRRYEYVMPGYRIGCWLGQKVE